MSAGSPGDRGESHGMPQKTYGNREGSLVAAGKPGEPPWGSIWGPQGTPGFLEKPRGTLSDKAGNIRVQGASEYSSKAT